MTTTEAFTWDSHVHVIGDKEKFPLAPSRGYEPPFAPIAALLAHLDALGAARAVIVQPSVYGFDNSCLLDAISRSDGRCIGVAVPPPGATEADLERLHVGGVRGIRCNVLNPGGLNVDQARAWWPWMRAHGWHLQVQIDATRMDVASLANETGVPAIVVDHMGYPPPGTGADGIASLVDAVSRGQVHVKISAPYRLTTTKRPYPDAMALALALLGASAEHCLCGSDWPHTDLPEAPMPSRDWFADLRGRIGLAAWQRTQTAATALYGEVT